MIEGNKISEGIYEIKDIPLKKKILYSPLAYLKACPTKYTISIFLPIMLILLCGIRLGGLNPYNCIIFVFLLTIIFFIASAAVMTSQNKKRQYLKVSDENIIELINEDTLQSIEFFNYNTLRVKNKIIQIKDVVYIVLKCRIKRRRRHTYFSIDACIAIPAECLEGNTNNFDIKKRIANFEEEVFEEAINFVSNSTFTEIQYTDNKYLFAFAICLICALTSMLVAFIGLGNRRISIFFAIMNFIMVGISIYGYLTPINARTFEFNEKGIKITRQKEEYKYKYIRWSEIRDIRVKSKELEIKYEPPKKIYGTNYIVKIYEKFLQKEDFDKLKEILLQNFNKNQI